jgi:DNA-binding response OmpR family regulator
MPRDDQEKRRELILADEWDFSVGRDAERAGDDEVELRPPRSYWQALGDEPIRVGIVEFRIMAFLATRPYHAFTRHEIAHAVTSASRPVAEGDVDGYVGLLRDQLGVLSDFVQTVPYVGYRFKA